MSLVYNKKDQKDINRIRDLQVLKPLLLNIQEQEKAVDSLKDLYSGSSISTKESFEDDKYTVDMNFDLKETQGNLDVEYVLNLGGNQSVHHLSLSYSNIKN